MRWTHWAAGRAVATIFLIVAICLGSFALSSSAGAEMQDKETCKKLKLERAEFLGSGILEDMSKGPEWVKDNLSAEQIDHIKRYIALDGRVIFQCQGGGGPAIKQKKSASGQKKARHKKSRRKKKIIRKKSSAGKKKTSSLVRTSLIA